MQIITTIVFQLKKMMGIKKRRKASSFLKEGLEESHEPSEQTISNILAFSKAYYHDKSDKFGEVEAVLN